MNRRITLDMAREAAEKMAAAKYDKVIIGLGITMADLTTKSVVEKYPMPVLKVIEEYPQYFESTCKVCLHITDKDKYLWSNSNIPVPKEKRVFDVELKNVETLLDVNSDLNKVKNQKSDFLNEMSFVLSKELRYEEKVRQMLPEALPYITFPDVVQLPALEKDHYSKLRDFIKSIK